MHCSLPSIDDLLLKKPRNFSKPLASAILYRYAEQDTVLNKQRNSQNEPSNNRVRCAFLCHDSTSQILFIASIEFGHLSLSALVKAIKLDLINDQTSKLERSNSVSLYITN